MASAEVNMQDMSEVVIVTLPEPGEPPGEELPSVVEEDKTLLLANDTREEVLEVAADQAEASPAESLSKDQAVIVKLSEQVDVEAEVLYPITCADVKASLVWKKFVCPGINVKCVQFNQQLISPKEFVCLAGKSTLKDWKRAIRLNGTMLRKIMDSGDLDFYQHNQVCSNTCRSTKIDLVGSKVSISEPAADLLSSSAASADLNGAAAFPEATEEPSEWVTAIGEDSLMFWRAVKEAGLLDEVVEDFQTELQVVLKGLQERVCDPPLQVKDAELLNNIVQNFGMLDLVKKVLAGHKSQMDRYREQYSRSLAALEQQCDEHRKQAKELKNKSQHLNNVLMTLTPAPPPPPKRPRLTRTVSGPATVGPAPLSTHLALPLSPLPGLPVGKLLTVGGAGGAGRFTLLTSPLSGPELHANASNLSVLEGGGRGGGGVVKVLGPQFQVVTLPTPLQNTTPSLQNTTPSLQNTTPPLQNTTPPLQNTTPPLQNTTPSLQNTTPPLQNTPPPLQNTTPSLQNTTPPLQNTTPPLQNTTPSLQNTTPSLQSEVTAQQASSISVMHDLLEEAPADGGEEAPADGGEEAPADGGEEAPADGGDGGQADGGEEGPADGGEEAPADGGEEGQADGGEEAPADGGEEGQADGGEGGQADGGDGDQADGGETG